MKLLEAFWADPFFGIWFRQDLRPDFRASWISSASFVTLSLI
jgi:hypothetical protein